MEKPECGLKEIYTALQCGSDSEDEVPDLDYTMEDETLEREEAGCSGT